MPVQHTNRPTGAELEECMETGKLNFSRWFTRVMDNNGWSHPTLVALTKACTGSQAFLHSSQIAGLRAARLKSPGPRAFAALEYLWLRIDEYQKVGKASDGVTFGSLTAFVQDAEIMRDPQGNPATLGFMIEVFAGLIEVPIDLNIIEFSETHAKLISENAGRLIRRMMVQERWDLIDDIHRITSKWSADPEVRTKAQAIIVGQSVWFAEELNDRLREMSKMLERVFKYSRTPPELRDELLKKY